MPPPPGGVPTRTQQIAAIVAKYAPFIDPLNTKISSIPYGQENTPANHHIINEYRKLVRSRHLEIHSVHMSGEGIPRTDIEGEGEMHGEGQDGLHPNEPQYLLRPGRYVIPLPMPPNQVMPIVDNALTPYQQRIRDLIVEFDPLIDPLYQQIQALPVVGHGVADTNENRELIREYLALVRARRVRVLAIQALAAQHGHGLGGMGKPHHMLRGAHWHEMQNRR
jgi:hypothetical protein